MPSRNCPLCKEKATYKYLTYGMNDKCFTCKNCQSFAIEDQAEEYLNKSVQQNLHELLSEKSKSAEVGKVLFIQYVGGSDTESVDTEYVEEAFLD
jgi:hypothetical protein